MSCDYMLRISYIVIVMNNNTGQVIVNVITTNTYAQLPLIQSCQYYTANVTAFSSDSIIVIVWLLVQNIIVLITS